MGVDAKRIWHPRGPNSSFQIRLSAGGINGTIPHEEKGTKPVNDDSGIFNCYKVRPDTNAPNCYKVRPDPNAPKQMMNHAKRFTLLLLVALTTCMPVCAQSSYDDSGKQRIAQRILDKYGVSVDWQNASFSSLLDAESRMGTVKRVKENYGVSYDWEASSLSSLLDIESRMGTAKRVKEKFGVSVDWQNASFSSLLDAESRMGTAKRIQQKGGELVDWHDYSLSQLLQMEQAASTHKSRSTSVAIVRNPEDQNEGSDQRPPPQQTEVPVRAVSPAPSVPTADSLKKPPALAKWEYKPTMTQKILNANPSRPITEAPAPPQTQQPASESSGGFIIIILVVAVVGIFALCKKNRELKEAQERQKDADRRRYEAEQMAQEEQNKRASNERKHAEERQTEDARRRAEEESRFEKEQRQAKTQQKGRAFYARILGLQTNFTGADIKKRYRELVRQYHPDKVNHLGPKLKEVAEREMKEINEAYAFFKNNGDVA